jgi:hypothetical protein
VPTIEELAKFSGQAALVREIAKRVFDQRERRIVLDFVADVERLAKVRTVRSAFGQHDV